MKLAKFSSNPTLRNYMQGAAKQAIPPLHTFLAPTVDVATQVGRVKKWDEKTGVVIPTTRRATNGEATKIDLGMSDFGYELLPNALDFPVDRVIEDEDEQLNLLQEGADIVAQLGALAGLNEVTQLALATLGAGTDFNILAADADPVVPINNAIRSVILGAKGMSPLMNINLLWGFDAYKKFTENKAVRSRFVAGKDKSSEIRLEHIAGLFVKPVQQMVNEVVVDTNVNKDAPALSFLLGSSVIVFAAAATPTRYDTSFMKTLRKRGAYMSPRFYDRDDQRVSFAGFDWNEQIIVGNAAAGVRLNLNDS